MIREGPSPTAAPSAARLVPPASVGNCSVLCTHSTSSSHPRLYGVQDVQDFHTGLSSLVVSTLNNDCEEAHQSFERGVRRSAPVQTYTSPEHESFTAAGQDSAEKQEEEGSRG